MLFRSIVVLRLGRNNGVFEAATTSTESVIAAITGATDNVVARRSARMADRSPESQTTEGQVR